MPSTAQQPRAQATATRAPPVLTDSPHIHALLVSILPRLTLPAQRRTCDHFPLNEFINRTAAPDRNPCAWSREYDACDAVTRFGPDCIASPDPRVSDPSEDGEEGSTGWELSGEDFAEYQDSLCGEAELQDECSAVTSATCRAFCHEYLCASGTRSLIFGALIFFQIFPGMPLIGYFLEESVGAIVQKEAHTNRSHNYHNAGIASVARDARSLAFMSAYLVPAGMWALRTSLHYDFSSTLLVSIFFFIAIFMVCLSCCAMLKQRDASGSGGGGLVNMLPLFLSVVMMQIMLGIVCLLSSTATSQPNWAVQLALPGLDEIQEMVMTFVAACGAAASFVCGAALVFMVEKTS